MLQPKKSARPLPMSYIGGSGTSTTFRSSIPRGGGFETRFSVGTWERNFLHIGRIKEVLSNKKIAYSRAFQKEEEAEESLTTLKLMEKVNQTILTLKPYVIEEFQDNILEFQRESGVAGWNFLIKKSLKKYSDTKS